MHDVSASDFVKLARALVRRAVKGDAHVPNLVTLIWLLGYKVSNSRRRLKFREEEK